MKDRYDNDIEGALINIESRMDIIKEAVKLYKERLNGKS